MLRINDKREDFRLHSAKENDPGTTLIDTNGDIWLCVLCDNTSEHIWAHIDRHTGRAILCSVDKPSEAYGKLCCIELTILEK